MRDAMTMTPELQKLYERIKAFRFDEGEIVFPFGSRLARDNGWSEDYAAQVNAEYRKFAFLAVAAGHPVTPSDQVDQVWHLHLLRSYSYWNRFCKEVLRTPLHHEPTQGGKSERAKFNKWYTRTLESYRGFFGEDPPPDIWPAPNVRFGEDVHYRRVNTKRFWVVRKVEVGRLALIAMLILLPVTLLAACTNDGFTFSDSVGGGNFWIAFVVLGILNFGSSNDGPTELDLEGRKKKEGGDYSGGWFSSWGDGGDADGGGADACGGCGG